MRVHVTDHALLYMGPGKKSRTALLYSEIVKIISNNSFVRIGTDQGTDFVLVWDHHRDKSVILLVTPGKLGGERVVVSVWELSFDMPFPTPEQEQINQSRDLNRKLFTDDR